MVNNLFGKSCLVVVHIGHRTDFTKSLNGCQERQKLLQKDEEILQMQKLMAKLESALLRCCLHGLPNEGYSHVFPSPKLIDSL